jgi:hypothetical protein
MVAILERLLEIGVERMYSAAPDRWREPAGAVPYPWSSLARSAKPMNLKTSTPGRRCLLLASAIVLLCGSQLGCGLFGGANTQTMRASPSIPSSEGTLETSVDDNDNVHIKLKVERLPHPSKVTPAATVYVVWVRPGSAVLQNAGTLVVDDDMTGELETQTPYKTFQLTVTPEATPAGAQSTHDPVFTADVAETD